MKKILYFLRDYKKESVLAPLFKMLEATFELIVPLVMAAIIDVGIAGKDKNYVTRMCMVMVGLGLIGLVCSITAQFFAAKAAVGMASRLRHAVFSHIQKLSFSKIDQVGTSTLITRMTSDINQVQAGINLFLRLFLRSPFIVFGAMVMAFTVDVKAAFIFVVTIPLLSLVVFGVMYISIPLYKKVQGGLDEVLLLVRENLTGVRVIRAFHKEEEEIRQFDQKNQMLNKNQQYVGKISALTNPVTYVIVNMATLVLIWTGAVRVDAGYITQGEVVALVNYMSQILVELIKLANLIVSVTKAIACGKRVSDILDLEEGMPDAADGLSEKDFKEIKSKYNNPEEAGDAQTLQVPKVEFSGVSMSYHGSGEYAVNGIDFRAQKGETIGIIGGTGSGKSTVVNLIPRFYDVSEGSVKVDGRDVRSYDIAGLRQKIGVVMQKAVLFKGTIRENLKWGNPNATDAQLYAAIEAAQAMDVIQAKENGLDEQIEQGGKNLSGGQRQRLTIARALVRRPEVLILDDSASALDFATDAKLRKSLRELDYDPTVFIVSQRTSSVQSADCILVLDDGELVGKGTHEKLLESCGVYQEIYASQFRSHQSDDQPQEGMQEQRLRERPREAMQEQRLRERPQEAMQEQRLRERPQEGKERSAQEPYGDVVGWVSDEAAVSVVQTGKTVEIEKGIKSGKDKVKKGKAKNNRENRDTEIKGAENRDAWNKEMINAEMKSGKMESEEIEKKQTQGGESSAKEIEDKDTNNEDAKNKDIKNKDTNNKDTKNKSIKNKSIKNKDIKSKDIKNKEPKNKDIKHKDTKNKNKNKQKNKKDGKGAGK